MKRMLVPTPHDVLASDAERERVVEALRTNAAAGRLDADELEERLGRAYAARVRADLVPLTADLPAPQRAHRTRQPRRRSIPMIAPVIPIAVLLVAIWALTGADYFWPVWPIGGMLLTSFKHTQYWARPHRPRT